jgi:hypothetical protein
VNFNNDNKFEISQGNEMDLYGFRGEDGIPDFVRASPRWKKIHNLSTDIDLVSKRLDSFGRYLRNVRHQIRQDELDMIEQEMQEKHEEERAKNFQLGIITSPVKQKKKGRGSVGSKNMAMTGGMNSIRETDSLELTVDVERST